jgi:RNA polymerase sigma factor (TIGR02999 family)
MTLDTSNLTGLLERWRQGDRSAENALIAEIYPIMCAQAQAQLGRLPRSDLTLCATELAHEAYARLRQQQSVDWRNRNHFLAIVATVIRRVMVDYLRQRSADKRGDGWEHLSIDEVASCQIPDTGDFVDLFALDRALESLGESDPELLRVIELRIFSGLGVDEIAEVCGISTATVGRRWRFARAWLSQHLASRPGRDGDDVD